MMYIEYISAYIPGFKVRRDDLEILGNELIKSVYFPWVLVILVLNRNNWKKPVVIILVGYWLLRSIGFMLRDTMNLRKGQRDTVWPYSTKNWYISNALAHVFWLSGEIMGDWYPLLRTKAITNNSRKMKSVYITCIIYNLVKVFGMATHFLSNPIDLRAKSVTINGNIETHIPKDIQKYNIAWWSTVAMINVTSIIYDFSVIYCMRKSLFDRLKEYKTMKENTFMDKFKQISEFRIVISMAASVIFLFFVVPFVIAVVMESFQSIKTPYTVSEYRKEDIEALRQVVLCINYNLMYIDQILLRRFIEKNKPDTDDDIKKSGISNSSSKSNPYKKLNANNDPYDTFSPSSSTLFKSNISSVPNSNVGISYAGSSTFNDSYHDSSNLQRKDSAPHEQLDYYQYNPEKSDKVSKNPSSRSQNNYYDMDNYNSPTSSSKYFNYDKTNANGSSSYYDIDDYNSPASSSSKYFNYNKNNGQNSSSNYYLNNLKNY